MCFSSQEKPKLPFPSSKSFLPEQPVLLMSLLHKSPWTRVSDFLSTSDLYGPASVFQLISGCSGNLMPCFVVPTFHLCPACLLIGNSNVGHSHPGSAIVSRPLLVLWQMGSGPWCHEGLTVQTQPTPLGSECGFTQGGLRKSGDSLSLGYRPYIL